MAIIFNGVTVKKVIYNGAELDKVIYNGVTVFENIPSTSEYDYAFDESTGVLTLNNAPYSRSRDELTIL